MADKDGGFDSAEQRDAYVDALAVEKEFRTQTGRDTKGVDAELARAKKQSRPRSGKADDADAED